MSGLDRKDVENAAYRVVVPNCSDSERTSNETEGESQRLKDGIQDERKTSEKISQLVQACFYVPLESTSLSLLEMFVGEAIRQPLHEVCRRSS